MEARLYEEIDAEDHVRIARLLLRSSKLDEARQIVELALADRPNLAEAHVLRGRVYQRRGEIAEALMSYARAYAIDRKSESLAEWYAGLLRRVGRNAEANAVAAGDNPQPHRVVRRHVIISGTGRAGTSFLVQLLTRLGLDTGYAVDQLQTDPQSHAGFERDLADSKSPFIVKSPWLCHTLSPILEEGSVIIERAIIPVRDFSMATQSRIRAQRAGTPGERVPGGLWLTQNDDEQIGILYEQFGNLIATLVRHAIPVIFLWYPRLAQDADYTFGQLQPIMPGINRTQFRKVFSAAVRSDLVGAQ